MVIQVWAIVSKEEENGKKCGSGRHSTLPRTSLPPPAAEQKAPA
jgi:hypothetical protein